MESHKDPCEEGEEKKKEKELEKETKTKTWNIPIPVSSADRYPPFFIYSKRGIQCSFLVLLGWMRENLGGSNQLSFSLPLIFSLTSF